MIIPLIIALSFIVGSTYNELSIIPKPSTQEQYEQGANP